MGENEIVKKFKRDDRFKEWENKWRNEELYLDLVIESDFAKEIINSNLKIELWIINNNYKVTLKLNEQRLPTCEIEFLIGEYDSFCEGFKRGRLSKIEIIDYDVTE